MLSTCPSCLSQVNHADHLFDVTCECGAHFSPYLNVDDTSASVAAAHPSHSFADYAESGKAFSEIVKFGEALGTDLETPIEPTPSPVPHTSEVPLPQVTASVRAPGASDMLLTTGPELSGYVIQTHFPPASVFTSFNPSATNPIQQGISLIWKQAEATGANAIVGLQTILSPDCKNILLIGIPVRCSKVV